MRRSEWDRSTLMDGDLSAALGQHPAGVRDVDHNHWGWGLPQTQHGGRDFYPELTSGVGPADLYTGPIAAATRWLPVLSPILTDVPPAFGGIIPTRWTRRE